MKFAILALLPAAVLGQAQAVFDRATPVRFEGAGCPTTSPGVPAPTATFSANNRSVTVNYPAYNVIWPGSSQDKPCDIFFNLNWPTGCTNLRVSATSRGQVTNLTPGVVGTFRRTYDVQDVGQFGPFINSFRVNQPFQFTDAFIAQRRTQPGQNVRPFVFRSRLNLQGQNQAQTGNLRLNSTIINLTSTTCQ